MRIRYEPTGINNFHNQSGITLVVSGDTQESSYEGEIYLINKRQAKHVEKHFCGMSDCRCPKGVVLQLDPEGEQFGIPVKWVDKL